MPPQPFLSRWALRLAVYPMFFASGAASLIYEVTWTRQLLYTFGAGLYAITAVLAAFMAGLALGAWLLGRVSDRLSRPLAAYGALELGIGICGLVLPHLLGALHLVDGWAYRSFGQDFAVLTAFRLVLTRFLVRDPAHLGLHVGGLYAINTFGAVCGAFAAGFLLIGAFGLRQTQWLAAAFNVAVSLLALLLSPLLDRPTVSAADAVTAADVPPADDSPRHPQLVRWIFFTAMMSGMVSLAAQVLWSRSLVFDFEYLKNTTYAFSAMLTVFLAGLALGSALIGPFIDRHRQPLRLYGLLLTLIGLAIACSVLVVVSGAEAMKLADPLDPRTGALNWLLAVANIMLQTVGVLGVPTLLMGMTFPIAARIVARVSHVGGDVGLLYSLNTVGAIIGSVAAAFLLAPTLGLTHGLLLLGAIDAVLGLVTVWQAPHGRFHIKLLAPPILLLLGFVLWLISGPDAARLQQQAANDRAVPFYVEGSLATVAVVENNLRERTLYVDGVGVAGTDPILQTDQKSLAHVPMMLLTRPASALTVGFGSGGASHSLLLHDRLQRIDCVEICRTVLAAAPTLAAANHLYFDNQTPLDFAEQDNRYNIILDDARAWLRYTPQRYDFIATDCTDLRYKSNANLYDVEYFRACRDRLNPGGIVVVWMPLGGLSEEVFKIALRTFHAVFPQMGIFYMDNEPTHYLLLVGWQDRIHLDYRLFERTLAEADVRQDLAELRLDDPVKLLSCFITGGETLSRYLGDGPRNTENHPLIEFESPKYGFGDQPMIENLDRLMSIRVSPRQFLDAASIPADARRRLERYEQALPRIIEGHAHYRNFEREGVFQGLEAATRAWMEAARLAPEDLSVKHLLQFPVLSQRLEQEPNNTILLLMFARVYMLQGDRYKLDLAYDALQRAERLLQLRRPTAAGDAARDIDNQLTMARGWLDEIHRLNQP
jgi:spermidine synthase